MVVRCLNLSTLTSNGTGSSLLTPYCLYTHHTSDTITTPPLSNQSDMTNFTQQTSDLALTGLRDGVPVDAIDALLLSVRDLGECQNVKDEPY